MLALMKMNGMRSTMHRCRIKTPEYQNTNTGAMMHGDWKHNGYANTGTGIGHKNETGKKRLSEVEETKRGGT